MHCMMNAFWANKNNMGLLRRAGDCRPSCLDKLSCVKPRPLTREKFYVVYCLRSSLRLDASLARSFRQLRRFALDLMSV